jgi:hydroxymethylbilane synthase
VDGDSLVIEAAIGSVDGKVLLRTSAAGAADEPEAIGTDAAEKLLASGAAEFLTGRKDA